MTDSSGRELVTGTALPVFPGRAAPARQPDGYRALPLRHPRAAGRGGCVVAHSPAAGAELSCARLGTSLMTRWPPLVGGLLFSCAALPDAGPGCILDRH